MTTFTLLALALSSAQPLQSANAERPAVCVAADTGGSALVSADHRDLTDSVKDLTRALSLLDRRHKFEVAQGDGPCAIRLLVLQRIGDDDEETYTLVTRLLAASRDGAVHDEELRATKGTWRGAASAVAEKIAFFVDSNRASLAAAVSAGAASAEQPTAPALPAAADAAPGAGPLPAAVPAAAAASRTIDGGLLDWVQLRSGNPAPQTPIYMRLFTADAADLGTGGKGGKETRTAEAQTLQSQGPALLRESFVAKAGAAGVVARAADDTTTLPADAVIVEGRFVTIDPGSRAKRYWVGFGAGKSALEIAGRFVTPAGVVLGEFRHRRIGAMGMGGGDSLGKLLSDTRSCGEDIATFVSAWLSGRPLK